MMYDRMIITAASDAFGPSVLALIGSLNLNWPNHPPIRVYDIGLDRHTIRKLKKHDIETIKVPPFCPHWRKHFTWKIWCLNDAPSQAFLWVDAGVIVLKPLNEVFEQMESTGYFFIPSFHKLSDNASLTAIASTGLSPDFCSDRMTVSGNFMGFKKKEPIKRLLSNILDLALNEVNIAATSSSHKHDQALISLLFYKNLKEIDFHDGFIYGGWEGPNQVPDQKVWVHRRNIKPADQRFFADHISRPGTPYIPSQADNTHREPISLSWIIRFIKRNGRRIIKNKCTPYDGIKY